MVLDVLDNTDTYTMLNPGFARAFEFLRRPDLLALPPGRYDLDGPRIYALVAKAAGRPRGQGSLEVHRKYADIQMVLSGVDEMGWKPLSACRCPSGAYRADKDVRFYTDEPDAWVLTPAGTFVIFFPEDAHLPLVGTGEIHKVVVKVAVG